MRRLSSSTWLFTSHFMMQNSVVTHAGGGAACIDPAYFPDEIDAIRAVFFQREHGRRFLLFTHGDFDHVLGLGGGAVTVIQREALSLNHQDVEAMCRQYDEALYVVREPAFAFPPLDRVFDERLLLDDVPLLLAHTPGHTADSAAVFHLEEGWAHVGDMLSDIEFPIVRQAFDAYRRSLERLPALLRESGVTTVIPGHGQIASGVGEIERRRTRDLRYLDDVERRVQDLAAAGADVDRCLSRTRNMVVGGRPIAPYHREFHEGNIALAFRETVGGGDSLRSSLM